MIIVNSRNNGAKEFEKYDQISTKKKVNKEREIIYSLDTYWSTRIALSSSSLLDILSIIFFMTSACLQG